MNKRYGLALGSGGPRGMVYIGVLKALEELDIEITHISGTSAGSLFGGLYALYGNIDKVEEIVGSYDRRTVKNLYKKDLSLSCGIFKGDAFLRELDRHVGDSKISDCKIPFVSVSMDITKGKKVYHRDGLLKDAIRASCSIPFLIRPHDLDNQRLVDGSLAENLPVEAVKNIGADRVIAVDVQGFPEGDSLRVKDMFNKLYKGIGIFIAEKDSREADKKIHFELSDDTVRDVINNKESYIQMGYDKTMDVLG